MTLKELNNIKENFNYKPSAVLTTRAEVAWTPVINELIQEAIDSRIKDQECAACSGIKGSPMCAARKGKV